jgi:hypothetical protein
LGSAAKNTLKFASYNVNSITQRDVKRRLLP